jgi:hypothetical protein
MASFVSLFDEAPGHPRSAQRGSRLLQNVHDRLGEILRMIRHEERFAGPGVDSLFGR